MIHKRFAPSIRTIFAILLLCSLSYGQQASTAAAQQTSTAAQPTIQQFAAVPVGYTQPSIQQIAQQLANSMQAQASAQNAAAVRYYNQAVAQYTAFYGTKPSATAPAPPVPPLLTIVDTAAVIQDEIQWSQLVSVGQLAQADKINWSAVYTQVPYVPVGPPPAVTPQPVVVIGGPIQGVPGFFTTVSGDGTNIPAGFVQNQDGHQYKKFVYGPFGSVMWQQIN